jgi:folylpolyglutamate synthase/dihydropteroate synthase
LPLADSVIFTKPLLPRAADPDDIARFAADHFSMQNNYLVVHDHGEALDRALDMAGPEDAVLVTGSLYTVSDIRAYWKKHYNP